MKTQAIHPDSDPAVLPTGRSMDSDMKPPPKMAVLNDPKGFALLDLLITVMILGILGMATFSTANNWTLDQKLSRACQVLISAIEQTRTLSIRYQRPFKLTLSTPENRIKIVDTAPYPNAVPPQQLNNTPPVNAEGVVVHPLSHHWYDIDFDTHPGLENVTLFSGPVKVTFDAIGNKRLADVDYVLTAGGQSRTIRVSGVTGRVAVQ